MAIQPVNNARIPLGSTAGTIRVRLKATADAPAGAWATKTFAAEQLYPATFVPFLGDSETKNDPPYSANPGLVVEGQAYADVAQDFWDERARPFTSSVRGVIGETTTQIRARLQVDVLDKVTAALASGPATQAVVHILAGINNAIKTMQDGFYDSNLPLAMQTAKDDIVYMVTTALAHPGVVGVVVGTYPKTELPYQYAIDDLNDWIVATVPTMGNGTNTKVANYAAIPEAQDPSNRTYSQEGVHPNAALLALMGKVGWKTIQTLSLVAGNVTPDAPGVTSDDTADTLSFTHALGTSELEVSVNGGAYVAYAGPYSIGNVARPFGYYKARVKAAPGRNASPVTSSPAFTVAGLAPPVDGQLYAGGYKEMDAGAHTDPSAPNLLLDIPTSPSYSAAGKTAYGMDTTVGGPRDNRLETTYYAAQKDSIVGLSSIYSSGVGDAAHLNDVQMGFYKSPTGAAAGDPGVMLRFGNASLGFFQAVDGDVFAVEVNYYTEQAKFYWNDALVYTKSIVIPPVLFGVVALAAGGTPSSSDCRIKAAHFVPSPDRS